MFEYFIGQIRERTPTHLVLDVAGVGFKLLIPLSTYEKLPKEGEVKIFAQLSISGGMQESDIRLYGFATLEERQLFQLLSTVNRVGPTTALRILSGTAIADFRQAVVSEDVETIERIKGIGAKTAQRIIVELKDALKDWVLPREAVAPGKMPASRFVTDAVLALVSLGYPRPTAEKAVKNALKKVSGDFTVEDLVKKTLQQV